MIIRHLKSFSHKWETKTKYVIEYGIAPYFRKNMLNVFINQLFTFKVYESTTNQIKKQYDGMFIFGLLIFGKSSINIVVLFLLVIVPVNNLITLWISIRKLGWYAALLKHLGMNGPSINLRKFQEDLKNHFEETTGEKFSWMWTLVLTWGTLCFSRKEWLFFQLISTSLLWTFMDFLNYLQHVVKIMLC